MSAIDHLREAVYNTVGNKHRPYPASVPSSSVTVTHMTILESYKSLFEIPFFKNHTQQQAQRTYTKARKWFNKTTKRQKLTVEELASFMDVKVSDLFFPVIKETISIE